MEHVRFASAISEVYSTYAMGLQNIYLKARLAGQSMTPRAVLDAQFAASEKLQWLVSRVDERTTAYLQQTAGAALADAKIAERGATFVAGIRRQAAGDMNQLVRALRAPDMKGAFNVAVAGPMKELLRRKQQTLTLTSLDTAGRRWDSPKLATVVARDFAYQLAIDAQARAISQTSDLAQVVYPNPAHVNHGLIISLTGAEGYPSLADVRPEIFHPNATAQLAHVRTQ